MIFPARVRVPALGLELAVEVEFELPAEVLQLIGSRPEASPCIDDHQLRARWGESARSLKRKRDRREIPFVSPSPRKFLYRIEDVEKFEREHTTEAWPRKRA